MNEIYIIEKSSTEPYENWSHTVGWVETEEEAKDAVKKLEEATPQCPFGSDGELEDFEDALYDWGEIQSPMEDELWAKNPYQDGSEFHRPTNIDKYNEYMAGVDRQLKETRKTWFEQHHPQWADKLEAYDEWEDNRYENSMYSYYSVPKLEK